MLPSLTIRPVDNVYVFPFVMHLIHVPALRSNGAITPVEGALE